MNLYFYYTGASAICVILILSLLEKIGRRSNPLYSSNSLYLLAISTLLIINKMCFLNGGMINEDESVMLVGGRALGDDFRPWVSLDPTTSGPLNYLPALFLLKICNDASYGELRLLYIISFQIPAILLLFDVINKTRGGFLARVTIAPLVLCLAFLFHPDHIHASSEHLPFLLTAIYLATIILIAEGKVKTWHVTISGMACVAGVFAKLQMAPLSLLAFLACSTLLIRNKKSWKYVAIFIASALITAIFALLFICSYDGFQDFIQSYIYSNLAYTNVQYSSEAVSIFVDHNTNALLPVFCFLIFISVWAGKNIIVTAGKREFTLLGILLLMLFVSVYCIAKPGRFFVHYGMLLIVPLYGCFLWFALYSAKFDKKLIPYFAAIVMILFVFNTKTAPKILKGYGKYQLSSAKIGEALKTYAHPNEKMAAWGWATPYLHESGLLPGTRDVHSDSQVSYTGAIESYYKARFLSDLERNAPEWFLDISAPGEFGGSEENMLENFPAVHDFVVKNYEVVMSDKTAVLYQQKRK